MQYRTEIQLNKNLCPEETKYIFLEIRKYLVILFYSKSAFSTFSTVSADENLFFKLLNQRELPFGEISSRSMGMRK